jgi:general stress protein 26
MDQLELMRKLTEIMDNSHAGILSTTDHNGIPHLRWMTPVLLKGRKGVIYSVTSQHSKKVGQINQNSDVTWMIQSRSLDQIVTLYGKTNILNNPSIKSEVLETVGDKLTMFWSINEDLDEFVVLETVIEKAVYFRPAKGVLNKVNFV